MSKQSLSSLIKKSKQKAKLEEKSTEKPKETRIIFGSGITKRVAEKAEKEQAALQAKSFSVSDSKNENLGKLINLNIPSTLMDDSIILDEDQKKAVETTAKNRYSCIIGQAGVGKTTVSKAVLQRIINDVPTIDLNTAKNLKNIDAEPDYNAAICIVSFMGKAVQQIKRALPEEYHPLCNTIHATLGYAPIIEDFIDEDGEKRQRKVFRPYFTEYNKLPFKICLIDEGGTVPTFLYNELKAALPSDCRIIIMGDLNQIPPVSGHSVLGFAINKWPTSILYKIHRQKEGNPIIENSDRIINGKKPLKDSKKFIIQNVPDGAMDCFQHTLGIIQTLHKNNNFDPMKDAFIVPQNVEVLGQISFNEKLVRYFNPTIKNENGIALNPPIIITAGYTHETYAVGDKVMVLANDSEQGLTNGMIGVVKAISPNEKFKGDAIADQVLTSISTENITLDLTDLTSEIAKIRNTEMEVGETERQASHIMTVEFQNVDEPISFKSAGDFRKVTHSYAMTCHKSQGSEYDTVVILVHSSNKFMLNREWLYTAVTRAKNRVILICNQRGLTQAVNKQRIKGKTIQEKADKFTQLSGKEDQTVPNLNEPELIS